MASTQKLIASTINAVKSADDKCYTSSEHSVDGDSGIWSACSSSDMCTPMPHITSHPINLKRYSNSSDRSHTSATHTSAAFSDVESTEYNGTNLYSDVMNREASYHHTVADAHTWYAPQALAPTATQLSNYKATSAPPLAYNAFNSWRPGPISHAPFLGYNSAKAASPGVGEHSRSTSSSTDCWNDHGRGDHTSDLLCPSTATVSPFAQIAFNSLHNRPSMGMNLFPAAHTASLKPHNLMATQASLEAVTNQKSSTNARSLLDSLTPLSSAYPNPQSDFGAGASSLMDPRNLMPYSAAFGVSPLLYLYGLTPDLLAARSAALAQLVNANASARLSSTSTDSVLDDGFNSGNKKTNLYKTELCRSWEEKGTCRYGSKCQFAHGQEELNNVSRHPKFKTEICRTFWLHGSCPYGKRCCFLHTTSNEAGAPPVGDAGDDKLATKPARSAHDPPTSRLQKRVSSSPLSATSPAENSLGISSPRVHVAPATCSVSDFSHSRSNSNSSCGHSSDGSSHIDSLRIQIWPRFGSRAQVPAQDAPGPRSRLQRLRPTEDYIDSSNSLPSTSTLNTSRYSSLLDCHQPPYSAFSDVPSVLARSTSLQTSKARSATGVAEAHWPLSRLPSSAHSKA